MPTLTGLLPCQLANQQTHWDSLAEAAFNRLWRAHADQVNRTLLARWLPTANPSILLKTDAFDEAMGEGPLDIVDHAAGLRMITDISHPLLKYAIARHPYLPALCADARSLPFRPESLHCVISLSTLDHFSSANEIRQSLAELHRSLKPGGTLIITLDNPQNPVVRLRNSMPKKPLYATGVLPYHVGATYCERDLRKVLSDLGFDILDSRFVLHCPRILAIPLSHLIARLGDGARRWWLSMLFGWERLDRFPTARRTGHFVAVLARKRDVRTESPEPIQS
ncbi:class I SAM-dependent methyltransferase [bacterium]|nr:class I SAM-dependent methyltransferase [bacterium]